METFHRRLMWHGIFVFVLGMLSGIAEPYVTNIRMGLSMHLVGLMNGVFLIVLGSIWSEIRLSIKTKTAIFWSALYGAYSNWAITLLAAIFGTAVFCPITSAGHVGTPWQENIVMIGFLTVGVSMFYCTILTLTGLGKKSTD